MIKKNKKKKKKKKDLVQKIECEYNKGKAYQYFTCNFI